MTNTRAVNEIYPLHTSTVASDSDNGHNSTPYLHALHQPRIDLDEIQCHRIRALGHLERLFDIMPLPFGVVTTTHVAILAACCDRTAVPALEIIFLIKFGSY